MNKLTEIKQTIDKIKNNGDGFFEDFASCFPNDERAVLIENAKPWIEHLLSLLEEKDKALSFYADEDNYTIGNYTRIENDMVYDWESKVQQDFGTKAKAALTSSNNEGETI